jgi:hypothetical protein
MKGGATGASAPDMSSSTFEPTEAEVLEYGESLGIDASNKDMHWIPYERLKHQVAAIDAAWAAAPSPDPDVLTTGNYRALLKSKVRKKEDPNSGIIDTLDIGTIINVVSIGTNRNEFATRAMIKWDVPRTRTDEKDGSMYTEGWVNLVVDSQGRQNTSGRGVTVVFKKT